MDSDGRRKAEQVRALPRSRYSVSLLLPIPSLRRPFGPISFKHYSLVIAEDALEMGEGEEDKKESARL